MEKTQDQVSGENGGGISNGGWNNLAHHYIIEVGDEGNTGEDITIGYEDLTSGNVHGIGDYGGIVGSGSVASDIPILSIEATQRKIDENHCVAPFLIKLYKIVNDEETHSIISWGTASNSFIIFDEQRFITEILPSYFKTGRFATFISQLNNYGFKKKRWNLLEFENEYFQQGKQHLLRSIKRRNQQSKAIDNMPSLSVPTNELKATFGKVRHGHKQIVNRIKRFKHDTETTLSDIRNIIEPLTKKLISTLSHCVGRKRKFVDIDPIVDLLDIEKDLESMYDQFEVPDSDIEGLTALSDLTEKVATLQGCRAGRACRRGEGRRVPPFLHKLYNMVEKQEIDDLISWNLPYRDSFIIWDTNKFAAHVLPTYFSHTNFCSFHSQLNIYGFKKVCWERHEYANEWFLGGRGDLLSNITRREKSRPLIGPAATFSLMEIEIFMSRLKAIQQEHESKIIWLSYYEEEMKISVDKFKEIVINLANAANKMISKSNRNLENAKKGKVVSEENGIVSANGQNYEVDELGEHNASSKDNNNSEAQSYVQELQIDLEAVQKIMEREDTWIFAREIAHCLSMTTTHEHESD